MDVLRRKIVTDVEAVGGRHDEPEIYDGDPGDPGLAGGPGSISWEVNGDIAAVGLAGAGAVIMEVLHPSVMAGVAQQSSYRTDPLGRARNTLGYVLRTTFGSTPAATQVIERVRRIHSHVDGTRPDGIAYRALDPELIAWVHTCIPWAIMTAFDRYRRPLSDAEKDRYLTEQAVIGRMGGADEVPETVADLRAYVEEMRPRMAFTEQTRAFVDFLAGDSDGELRAGTLGQLKGRLGISASMLLMPAWAQHLTGTYQPLPVRAGYLEPQARLTARLVAWAVPVLPCHEMAERRARARPAAKEREQVGSVAV